MPRRYCCAIKVLTENTWYDSFRNEKFDTEFNGEYSFDFLPSKTVENMSSRTRTAYELFKGSALLPAFYSYFIGRMLRNTRDIIKEGEVTQFSSMDDVVIGTLENYQHSHLVQAYSIKYPVSSRIDFYSGLLTGIATLPIMGTAAFICGLLVTNDKKSGN